MAWPRSLDREGSCGRSGWQRGPDPELTPFTCFECGGTLWLRDDHGAQQLRCRVGHTYSVEGLLRDKRSALEHALWAAVVALGQFTIASAKRQGAGRVLVVDGIETRLALALGQNAEVIDFNKEDPVEVIKHLTGGVGVDRAVDAVGIDAQHPLAGPAAEHLSGQDGQFDTEQHRAAPDATPRGDQWVPGDAPSLVGRWAVEAVAKAGSIGIIGVYSPDLDNYPIGQAMNKNLTLRMGNCNHRRYIPRLLDLVATGVVDPAKFITQHEPPAEAISAYQSFDRREEGWVKTVLDVAGT